MTTESQLNKDVRVVRPAFSTVAAAAAMLFSTNVPETDYPEWNNGTAYAIGARVIRAAGVAATHMVYEAVTANTGMPPETNNAATGKPWILVSATNRYKMLDTVSSSQTAMAEVIDITLNPGRVDSLYLGNLDATKIIVTQFDSVTNEEYYYHEEDLTTSLVTDWFEYFTEPTTTKKDVTLFDLITFSTARLRVQIFRPGGTAKCGTLLTGLKTELGEALSGVSVRIVDYSGNITDTFGTVVFVKRENVLLLQGKVYFKNNKWDYIIGLMREFTSVNLLWSFSDEYGSLSTLGFKKDFEAELENVQGSYMDLQIQGIV